MTSLGIRKSLIASILFLFSTGLHAQEFGNPDDAQLFDSRFISGQYEQVFSLSPAMLTYWTYGSWSNIGGSYKQESGDFRNAQKYDQLSLFSVQTESFLKLNDTGWMFYGKFSYANGGADSVSNNLSFYPALNGSPYYLFTQRAGVWKLQNYAFNVIASRQMNDRFSMGIRVLYRGDLAFRYNDTRNSQPSLFNDIALSASYRLGDHVFSAGATMHRNKTEPALSNKYPQNTFEEIYNLYINAGLGTYLRTQMANTRLTFEGASLGAVAQWMYKSGANRYSFIYSANFGEEYMIRRDRLIQAAENKILKYYYGKHQVNLSGMNTLPESFLTTHASFSYVRGEGSRWSDNFQAYQDNYLADITELDINATLYRPGRLLSKAGIQLALTHDSRFDRIYGYSFSYTKLAAGADMTLTRPLKDHRLSLGAGGHYHVNMNLEHDPNASINNLYTRAIAEPLMGFLTADHLRVPLYVEWQIPLKANMLQLLIEAEHWSPLRINYSQGVNFGTSDSFLILHASLKLFF